MIDKQTSDSETILDEIVTQPYKYGFKTAIETEEFPKGINLNIVEQISLKKNEPQFLKDFRIKAFKNWQKNAKS
jgi:Fe-S cluster assembly protein SufB